MPVEHSPDVLKDQVHSFTARHLGMKQNKLSTATRLNRDLGMDGGDAGEFFKDFAAKFGVVFKIRALGIDFVSLIEAVDTSLSAGELLYQMIGAVAQFERSLISERVKAGLDHARKSGVILGRPALRRLTNGEIIQLRRERIQGKLSYRALASKFGTSIWTAHTLCEGRNLRITNVMVQEELSNGIFTLTTVPS